MNWDMIIKDIIEGKNIDLLISNILWKIHINWPLSNEDFELLSYCKKFHPNIFSNYEKKLIYLIGLFYKTSKPESLLEEVYSIYSESIKEDSWWRKFTPFQYDAYKKINEKIYFSFSAPTSAWKSYLFRELIQEIDWDIIIVVPSRALIAEYMYKVKEIIWDDKTILLLPFLDSVNRKKTKRKIFIITPERWIELFKLKNELDIKLFLFDEAQISEERIRWMQFDTFVRRSNEMFPNAKKVFAHPFINNPEAQLLKHDFDSDTSLYYNYKFLTVWKIFIVHNAWKFYFFSPYDKKRELILYNNNIISETLSNWWTILVYISKDNIYEWNYIEKYDNYIRNLNSIIDWKALELIEKLKNFIWSWKNIDDYSLMIEMMEKWVAIHHWSIPLKARYIIEEFINLWYAKICFSTATLLQWINMPFDLVWIDNFSFWKNEWEDQKVLNQMNLIWRAWRNRSWNESKFDYWYVIVEQKNLKKFSERLNKNITISSTSKLDEELIDIPEDLKDNYEAFKWEGFNDNLFLPNNQVERIRNNNIDSDILFILDNLLDNDNLPIKWKDYQNLWTIKTKIKIALRNIYLSHLRRTKLEKWEMSVLSASIPMLLWRIQWKVFKEIVWLRKAYITQKDEQNIIKKKVKLWQMSISQASKEIKDISLKWSQKAESLPNISLKSFIPLYKHWDKISDFKYDILIYDTYDYLDKVITFSLINPLSAAFNLYYQKTNNIKAKIMENFIRYWTNDNTEILLLRYWFSFEEIEKIKSYIEKINEDEIFFKSNINELSNEDLNIIKHYL